MLNDGKWHLTLVRLWEEGLRGELAADWVDWDGSGFSINAETRLGRTIRDQIPAVLTVESTSELVWVIEKWRIRNGLVRDLLVDCAPYLEHVRSRLLTNEYLVEKWLDAERRYRDTWRAAAWQRYMSDNDPPEADQ